MFNDGPWTHPSRGSGEDIFSKKEGGYGLPTPVALRACQKLDTGGHNYMEMAQVGIELLMQLTL